MAVTLPPESTLGIGKGVTSAVPVKAVISSISIALLAGNPDPLSATSDPGGPLGGDTLMAGAGTGVGMGVGVVEANTVNVAQAL